MGTKLHEAAIACKRSSDCKPYGIHHIYKIYFFRWNFKSEKTETLCKLYIFFALSDKCFIYNRIRERSIKDAYSTYYVVFNVLKYTSVLTVLLI